MARGRYFAVGWLGNGNRQRYYSRSIGFCVATGGIRTHRWQNGTSEYNLDQLFGSYFFKLDDSGVFYNLSICGIHPGLSGHSGQIGKPGNHESSHGAALFQLIFLFHFSKRVEEPGLGHRLRFQGCVKTNGVGKLPFKILFPLLAIDDFHGSNYYSAR